MTELNQSEIVDLLRQHVDAGCDAVLADAPVNQYAATAQVAQAAPIQQERPTQQGHPTQQGQMSEAPQAVAPSLSKAFTKPQTPAVTPAITPAVAPQISDATAPQQAAAEAAQLAAKADTLDALKSAMETFDGCPLKTTAKNTVFADGIASAKIMLIGEAPGQDEDREGRPFIGHSGELLDAMLGSIGLSRDENLYIANVVPWRPPGNRTPSLDEIAVCKPFITRHIELVQPDFLLLVGNISNKTLLGTETGITKLRGQWQEYQANGGEIETKIKTLPLLHPAYVLRRPETKAAYWADLCALKRRMLNA